MKKFNVTGTCVPSKNYMVDISGKLEKIMELIDEGCYFTINRARQYGKTTTLSRIQNTLPAEYICARISFQNASRASFETESAFCRMFLNKISKTLENASVPEEYARNWPDEGISDFELLDSHITRMCKDKKVVLLIDEFDKVGNFHVFLQFLSMLREKFLLRAEDMDYTFHNVILAGVYDIASLKQKMIDEGLYTPSEAENKTQGSPWNIAADFEVDMSFSPAEIATMLNDYEADHKTGMDMAEISEEIYGYTGGYPFLVSRICQCIDEKLDKNWTRSGVKKAVNLLITESNTLFDDVFKNLRNDTELHDYIYDLLISGDFKPYVIYNPVVGTGVRYGFLKRQQGDIDKVAVSNKIFELYMTDYFISKDLNSKKQVTGVFHSDIIKNGRFDMELCLHKFAEHYAEIYNEDDMEFLEKHGRLLFISYLKPLINGGGFYHIESQLTDLRRMDLVVDYGREQFIVELKIWHGKKGEMEAYGQLCGYLGTKGAGTGYLLSFDFRRGQNKERRADWVEYEGKRIFNVVV